jgi:hypothetical protein
VLELSAAAPDLRRRPDPSPPAVRRRSISDPSQRSVAARLPSPLSCVAVAAPRRRRTAPSPHRVADRAVTLRRTPRPTSPVREERGPTVFFRRAAGEQLGHSRVPAGLVRYGPHACAAPRRDRHRQRPWGGPERHRRRGRHEGRRALSRAPRRGRHHQRPSSALWRSTTVVAVINDRGEAPGCHRRRSSRRSTCSIRGGGRRCRSTSTSPPQG